MPYNRTNTSSAKFSDKDRETNQLNHWIGFLSALSAIAVWHNDTAQNSLK
jgi:hypothetical protein